MSKQNHVRLYAAVWSLIVITGIVGSCAHAQTFDLFRPANGILKGQTTTYVTTAATSADVISLWTGSCSSTTFLRGDGQCLSPGGAGIGTVTSVGLAWTGSGLTVSNSPVVSAGTLTFSGALNVATGGTGATTLTGLLEGNGTGAIDPAESADVITLWTGTCNATTFLRGDGSCQTIAGNTDASTLTTGTLADARLSANVALENLTNVFSVAQSITGGANAYAAPSLLIDNAGPIQIWNESDQAADGKRWARLFSVGCLNEQLVNDANSSTTTWLSACRTGMTSSTINLTGTNVQANGANILTSASTLNGSNVGTGTVADARLSANVPLKNVANQTFSAVGSNTLSVANSSTGAALLTVATNGIVRTDFCTSTISGQCLGAATGNDSNLRFTQKLNIVDGLGVSETFVAGFDTAQIDLNATAVNVNGSRINTVANTGRVAYGYITGASGALSRSLNVTSSSRGGVGNYSVNLTASGFTAQPICVATSESSAIVAGLTVSATGPAYTTGIQLYGILGAAAIDFDLQFTCHGP